MTNQKSLDKKKTKELDWRDKIDWVDDWLEIDCQVIFGEKGKKTLIKFIEYLLTQQRRELLEEIKDEIKKSMPVVPIEYKDGWDRGIDYVEQIIEDEIHFTDL